MPEKLLVPNNASHWVWDSVIPKLTAQANNIKSRSRDFLITNTNESNLQMIIPNKLTFAGNAQGGYTLTEFAARQMCNKLGFPIDFYQKLLGSNQLRYLLAPNINGFLNVYNRKLLLRTTDNVLRGFLSDKYAIFDTDRIMDVFTHTIQSSGILSREDLMFRGAFASLDRFHMRFTTSEPITGLQDSSPLYAGLELDSSDVGKAKLTVRYYIFRQVCSNGLCIGQYDKEFFTQKHMGVPTDEFRDGLIKSIMAFPIVTQQVTEAIKTAERQEILSDSPLFDLDNNEPVLKRLRSYFRMTESEIRDSVTIFRTYYPRNIWGFTNAITQKARDFDFEKRNTIEDLAGRFMFDWRKLHI